MKFYYDLIDGSRSPEYDYDFQSFIESFVGDDHGAPLRNLVLIFETPSKNIHVILSDIESTTQINEISRPN